MNEQEVLELKAQVENEFKKQSEAIDIVLELLRRKNGVSPSTATAAVPVTPLSASPKPQPDADSNTQRDKRVRGILKATRGILDTLPETFTSFQVRDALEQARPEFAGRIKLDSLRGVLKTLAGEGLIEQIEEGAGPRPALYRRIKRTTEANM